MLDYKSIIIKRYALGLSYKELAEEFSASKSGINDFIRAFERCEKLSYPLPEGITNYAIYELVYGHEPGTNRRNAGYEQPDFAAIFRQMNERKNMTLVYLWSRYQKDCTAREVKPYQYRQFCELYARWCNENYETLHIQAVIAQKMEVDFAGKTFKLIDKLTGEITTIVVFVAILPYSQYIYAEGMISTCEPQWIEVNNHTLDYFGSVPTIVVCDNCKQAVTANKDWVDPDLNKDYAAWADHNHTVILPAKVRKPKWKSSVENAVGILEKGFFHDLEENRYFSLEQFNRDLLSKLDALNHENFKKKNYSRYDQWMEERQELLPLPAVPYEYMERRTAKVSADFHVRFDNAYYSVDKAYLHKSVIIAASATTVNIYSMKGKPIVSWRRASRRGKWLTDPAHLPESYKQMSEWNATYFTRKAMTVGPNTVKVIEHILRSREHEVQTYRLCIGILNYTKKYSKLALEDCCKLAIDTNHISYSFIKNSMTAVAEEIGSAGFNTKLNEERNKGAFVMSPHAGDIERLLSKSSKLAGRCVMKKLDRINELVDELNELKLGCMAASLDALYHSERFDELDAVSLLEQVIGPEYQNKTSQRFQNRLKRAHLSGGPQSLDKCKDSVERVYLPSDISATLSSLDFIREGLNVCILGPSDSGKSYLAKALGIQVCLNYRAMYHHCEEFLEAMVALKQADYSKYQKKIRFYLKLDLLILDDFLLHTITDEREIKVLFEVMEKRSELSRCTIVCSQREPNSWASMILNNEVSANAILKRATKHYTVVIQPRN